MLYKAFISYSHAADGKLAPALQSALHHFAKPWYKMRAIRIFRDKTSLSANPALWSSIESALSESEFFLLLASPEAAQSHWVQQEVGWWLNNRSTDKLLLLVTDGQLVWDEGARDFNWNQTTALPANLRGQFQEVPLYVDLAWAKSEENLSLRSSRFRNAVLDVACPLHGKPKDELDGEDVRQHRKVKRLVLSAVFTLIVLTISSIVAAYLAIKQSNIAYSRELSLSSTAQLDNNPQLSLILAREAARAAPTVQAEDALRHSLLRSHVRKVLRGHTAIVSGAVFSPNGRSVLTASGDNTAQIWDAATGNSIAVLRGHRGAVTSAVFSRDGKYVVTASSDATARVWDAATGLNLALLQGHSGPVNYAEFSPDGKYIITASADRTARRWESLTGQSRAILVGPSKEIVSASFDSGGRFILTLSKDNSAALWKADTGRLLKVFVEKNAEVSAAALSPDGKWVVTTKTDGTATVWSTGRKQKSATLSGTEGPLTGGLAFSMDGKLLATTGVKGAHVWDTSDWDSVSELRGHRGSVHSVVFSSDGNLLVTASQDGSAIVWRNNGAKVADLVGHSGEVYSAIFSPDGRFVVTASADQTAAIWEISEEPIIAEMRKERKTIFTITYSPDGRFIAVGSGNGTIRIWSVATGSVLAELRESSDPVWSVAFSPDGKLLVAACADGVARIWEAGTWRRYAELRGHTGPVTSATFSPDSKSVLTGSGFAYLKDPPFMLFSRDHAARLWETSSAGVPRSLDHGTWVGSAAFSRDGKWILTVGEKLAQVWDANTLKTVKALPKSEEDLKFGLFSPDDSMIAVGSWSGTVEVWSTATWKSLVKLVGHEAMVFHAAFSPDSRWLITAAVDGTARLWNPKTGVCFATLHGANAVYGVSFSPDGRSFAVGEWDGTTRVYACDICGTLGDLCALADKRIGRPLTAEERVKYLH